MELDRADIFGEEALAEPVEPLPVDPTKVLDEFEWAEPSSALIKTGLWAEAYRTLPKQSEDADVNNNLGCVSAWLALTDDAYWPEALRALRLSRDKGDDVQQPRAERNLDRVQRARGG